MTLSTTEKQQEFLNNYDLNTITGISDEYGKLMDWFYASFPEGTLRLEVHSDQRFGLLEYKLTAMSGKEMTNDQVLLTDTITVTKTRFENMEWISNFRKGIFPGYKADITKAFNNQYNKEKEWKQ